ncbi:MAG: oligosaccharide flippase family protein [Thioalkalivibrio sp.]|nr:oligosaccharide flippase family protein [Thioalkalivibrio sp.]
MSRLPEAATGASAGIDREETNARLSRNVVSSIGAKILYLATRFSLPPLILAFITLEEYGLWALAFILVGYLGMGAFGVSNVYVRYVAQYHSAGEMDRIGDLLSTGLVLVSIFATATLIVLWFALPTVLTWFSVPAHLQSTAFVLIFGTVAVFMLDLSLGAFVYVLAGLQKIVLQNRIWIASFLLPSLRLSPLRFNREHLRLYIGFGGILQVSGLLSMFLRSVEKLIAGLFINVQAVGLFDVAQKFPVMATSIPSSINAAYLPAATQMHVQGRQQEFNDLYLGGARQINLLTGFMMGFMAAFAAPLITAWLGPNPDFALAPIILACFTLPFQLNVVTGAATNVYRGLEQPIHELLYPVSQLLLVVVLVGAGFGLFGVEIWVIVAGVACAMILSALFYFAYTNRFLGLRQQVFLRRVLLPGLLPYVTGFALLLLLTPWMASVADDRLGSLAVVLAGGFAYVTAQSALFWFLQLADTEKAFLRSRLAPMAGRFAALRGRAPTRIS